MSFLEKFDFKSVNSDKCVFIGKVEEWLVILALYVDDGLMLCECMKAIEIVLEHLKSKFKITSGEANEFVGIEIKRDRPNRSIKLSQPGYIAKIIDRFGFGSAHAVSTPAEAGLYASRSAKENKSIVDVPYREAIGSLLFAARVTRPEIEFAVNYLSQFCNEPTVSDWNAVGYVFRYLQGTRDLGIVYANRGSGSVLTGYTDSDLAGCPITRRSRSGFVFILNGGLVTWTSRRQSTVAPSTSDAEYMALFDGVREAVWLKRFLSELNVKCTAVPIYVDNQTAISIAGNREDSRKSKYIEIKYHYTRERIDGGDVIISFVKSEDQLADIFTKPLEKCKFVGLRDRLNVCKN